jgi:hypothetical protein
MNGLAGVIVGWDSRSNRQVVDLGRAGEDPVAVKRGNIQQHPDVKVVGTSQGEINNTRGQVRGERGAKVASYLMLFYIR